MDFKELQQKQPGELAELLREEERALHAARLKARQGGLKQVHTVALHRKTIARITMLLARKHS